MTINWRSILGHLAPFVPLIGLVILFVILKGPGFLSLDSWRLILTNTVVIGIAAMGMTAIIVTAGIDLSVGGVVWLGSTALVLDAGAARGWHWLRLC